MATYTYQAARQPQSPPSAPGRECSCSQQGCHYCYARAYYVRADHGNADEDFETRILVKANFADLLRTELARPSWRGEQVALGTSTDAYQPAEGRFRLTRRVLEVLRDAANPRAS
jgi:DNA repair photolyase